MGYLSERDLSVLKNRLCPGEEPTLPTEDEIHDVWSAFVMCEDSVVFLMEGLLFFNEPSNLDKAIVELGLFLQNLDIGCEEPSTNEFRPKQFQYFTENGQNFVQNQGIRKMFDRESAIVLVRLLFKIRHRRFDSDRIRQAIRNWILAIRTYYPNVIIP